MAVGGRPAEKMTFLTEDQKQGSHVTNIKIRRKSIQGGKKRKLCLKRGVKKRREGGGEGGGRLGSLCKGMRFHSL